MTGMKQIEFTQIADDWDSITLGEESPQALLEMRNGLTAKQVQDKGDYKVTRIETIGAGWIDDRRVRFVSGLNEKDIEKYLVRKGDILFSHINSDPHLGKTGIAKQTYPDLLHGMNLLLLRPNQEMFEPEFLDFVFQFYREKGVFIKICSRAVNQSSINQAKMKTLEVPLPPLPEQKKIAHILSTIQRAIEAQEQIIQTTNELKKALMQKLFTEGLSGEPQKETEIGLVPESWEVAPLSKVCTFQSGGTPSKQHAEYWEGSIPWVSPKDMKRPRLSDATDHISQEGLENGSKLAPAGAVFVVVRGMILAKDVPIALAEVPMAINQDMKAVIPTARLLSDFLLYSMIAFKQNLFVKIGRSAHGTMTLMSSEISFFRIPLPDIETQREIADSLHTLEIKQELHERNRLQLLDLFRTLLHELMTARIRVDKIDLSGIDVMQ
jgi:type I restriction enzyme S subunit